MLRSATWTMAGKSDNALLTWRWLQSLATNSGSFGCPGAWLQQVPIETGSCDLTRLWSLPLHSRCTPMLGSATWTMAGKSDNPLLTWRWLRSLATNSGSFGCPGAWLQQVPLDTGSCDLTRFWSLPLHSMHTNARQCNLDHGMGKSDNTLLTWRWLQSLATNSGSFGCPGAWLQQVPLDTGSCDLTRLWSLPLHSRCTPMLGPGSATWTMAGKSDNALLTWRWLQSLATNSGSFGCPSAWLQQVPIEAGSCDLTRLWSLPLHSRCTPMRGNATWTMAGKIDNALLTWRWLQSLATNSGSFGCPGTPAPLAVPVPDYSKSP